MLSAARDSCFNDKKHACNTLALSFAPTTQRRLKRMQYLHPQAVLALRTSHLDRKC